MSLPVNNLREFIAYAKANPGKVNYSHAGIGSSLSLAAELFKLRAGVDLTAISYKGTGPAVTAVIAGEVQATFPNTLAVVTYVKADRLRALGVTSAGGDPLLPGVPPIAGATGGNYVLNTWFGLFAPAKTPDRLVELLNAEVNKAYERPEVMKQLAALGIAAEPMRPAAFADYVRRDNEAIGALVRAANLKSE